MNLRSGAASLLVLAVAACDRPSAHASSVSHPAPSSTVLSGAPSSGPASASDAGLLDDIPNVVTTPSSLMRATRLERTWEAAGKPRATVVDKALTSVFEQAEHAKIDLASNPPYTGPDAAEFLAAASGSIGHLPDLALACALERGSVPAGKDPSCTKGIEILTAWATARSASGQLPGVALSAGTCPAQIDQAGLTIGRYFAQLGDGYRLLANDMDKTQREAVTTWFHALGLSIKTAHECWLHAHKVEGANNHLSWHDYGMIVAGLVAHDPELVRYATEDPSNDFTFARLVDVGIYEKDNARNEFRRPEVIPFANLSQDYQDPKYKTQPVDLTFGGNKNVRTGEIWDRYRHIACGHPENRALELRGCGFSYSVFNLHALVLTAHILAANGMPQPATVNDSLLNALRFYGGFYEQIAVGSDPDDAITDPVYHREVPGPDDFGAFVVAASDFPSEGIFNRMFAKNAKALTDTANAPTTVVFAP